MLLQWRLHENKPTSTCPPLRLYTLVINNLHQNDLAIVENWNLLLSHCALSITTLV